ncbi:MAG TPA: hypothetical protein VMB74_15240 [Streptosporangiaceae bacterium]|nr:hypothetical protein [Streptosporangiaceae bacterium]
MFKAVRGQRVVAGHIAAHGVSLDEVREAILEHPYWAAPAGMARRWSTVAPTRAATCWWW